MLDYAMSAAEWFDDWREWIEWVNSHDLVDSVALRQERTKGGRKRLSVSELVLHFGELSARAESWAYLCNAYCEEYGLNEVRYETLPPDKRARYARIPDSPVWGRARGMWVRREGLTYLQERLDREASSPLLWGTGLDCPQCGAHYAGQPGEASLPWLSDIRVGTTDEGFVAYRCSTCGCDFVYESGRTMFLQDAAKQEQKEVERVLSAFVLGRPVKWYDRLVWRLLDRAERP